MTFRWSKTRSVTSFSNEEKKENISAMETDHILWSNAHKADCKWKRGRSFYVRIICTLNNISQVYIAIKLFIPIITAFFIQITPWQLLFNLKIKLKNKTYYPIFWQNWGNIFFYSKYIYLISIIRKDDEKIAIDSLK